MDNKPYIFVDLNPNASRLEKKESHLHRFKAYPDPKGNRSERRAAKKRAKKK